MGGQKMKLKKIGMIMVSAMLLFSATGCGEKEQEQPKQPQFQTAMKQEKEEEFKFINNEKEILEKFPELKEVKEYLFENFSTLNREVQEKTEDKKTKPIEFTYTIKGEDADWFAVSLNFEESTTKKEMIEALQYSFEKITNLFLEESNINFQFTADIAFTNEGIEIEKYWDKWGSIKLEYDKSEGKEPLWKEKRGKSSISSWREINPENVKPDDMVAYFGEETPEQPAVSEPQPTETSVELPIATVRETLSQMGIEETTSLEASDGGFIIGEDKIGFIGYMAAGVDSEGNVQDIVYTAKKVEGLTAEDFVTNAGLYLMVCAKIPYGETEEGNQAAQFVANSLESALEQEQTIEIKGWNIALSYGKDTNMFALHLYFEEETPEQPAVSEPQGTSIQLSTVLSHINIYYDTTETSREKDDQTGNEIVKGSNEAGNFTYEITINDKEEVLNGIYKITKTTEANEEEFKMNVRGYLCNSASAQFEGDNGMKAFQVVSKCVEDVFDRAEGAEEEGTLEGVKFKVVVEKEKECIVMYVTN